MELKMPEWLIKFEELCNQIDKELEQEKITILKEKLASK